MQRSSSSSIAGGFRRRGLVPLIALLATVIALPHSAVVTATRDAGRPVTVEAPAGPGDPSEPGARAINDSLLIDGRRITPAGQQTFLGSLPLNAVLSPDGRFLLAINSGGGTQSVQVVDTSTSAVVQTIPYTSPASAFIGLAYSPDGTRAYAAGGGSEVVHTYSVAASGLLSPAGDITIGTTRQNPYPTGLSISPDGRTLYVANNLTNNVAVIDTAAMTVTNVIPVGSYPYTPLVSPDGTRLYVSNWGDGAVSVINLPSGTVAATVTVGSHPTAMAFGPAGLLYVSDSNSDAISVVNTATGQEVRRLSVSPCYTTPLNGPDGLDVATPCRTRAPLSSSPEGLTVSPDGKYLYVATAGNNVVTVFSTGLGLVRERLLGRIPTAWYPTAVVISRDGKTLFVTNGKGLGAGPNSTGLYPDPTRPTFASPDKYTASMIIGTLSTVRVPSPIRLILYSIQALRNNRLFFDRSIYDRSAGNPIPNPGNGSPIKHVIYIIKENRTYDQIFGDEPIGDGDPSLTLFGKANTPNLHALAERFGLLDNFYADAEVSADGHNWVMSANASDYNQKMWPQNYSSPNRNRPYDFEGDSAINLSPGGYLWDAAAVTGISYRNYGEFYQFAANNYTTPPASQAGACPGPTTTVWNTVPITPGLIYCFPASTVNGAVVPNLVNHSDPLFRGYDTRYSDSDRVAEWARDNGFTAGGTPTLPALSIVRLPNDHTAGTSRGALTPQAYAAQNDLAVGQLVDLVSHSSLWGSTAIFVTEDDAQNGPDHIDAHRTTSIVISPYTARATPRVDHTLYDTAAMIRTIELILGMPALSQYDARATPMWRLFNSTPDLTPYAALPESVSPSAINPSSAYGAQESAHMDFSQEDRAPMDALNRILWHAVKGATTPYPAPATNGGGNVDMDG